MLGHIGMTRWYDADGGAGGSPVETEKEEKPKDFKSLVDGLELPDEVKAELRGHFDRQGGALKKERDANSSVKEKLDKLAELEAAEAERKKAAMSEKERLEAEIAEREARLSEEQAKRLSLEEELASTRMENAVTAAAIEANLKYPKDVYKAADLSGLVWNEETGRYDGLLEFLDKFKADHPDWPTTLRKGDGIGTPQSKIAAKKDEKPTPPKQPLVRF